MLLEEAIRQTLGEYQPLVDLVDDRIYPGEVPDDDAPTPWLFFQVIEETPDNTLDSSDDWDQAKFVVEVFAKTYDAATQLRTSIRDGLNNQLIGLLYRCLWVKTSTQRVEEGVNATLEFMAARTRRGVVEAAGVYPVASGSFIISP